MTQAIVVFDAEPAVASDATRLRVRICSAGGDDGLLALDQTVAVGVHVDALFPARVPLHPGPGASSDFVVLAELFDKSDDLVGRERVIGAFRSEQTIDIERRFEQECRDVDCRDDETCVDGRCQNGAWPEKRDPVCEPEAACDAHDCPP